jgi:MFS family permease
MGWTNPFVDGTIAGGIALLALFVYIEFRVPEPMFRLRLFRIRAFTAGSIAGALGAMGRGGLQFVLIIWLQGIWLPLHGYSFDQTPLWAGIYMVPMTVGFLASGPTSGILSDRFGARPFATGGLVVSGIAFLLLNLLPINFPYLGFALLILVWSLGAGMFFSPNQAAVMNSLPPEQRGVGAGMLTTFQNAANVLSMGAFFTVITLGLASSLPSHLYSGLVAQGVPAGAAHAVSALPPIGTLFAAFLGYNAVQIELGHTGALASLPHAKAAYLTGRQFFPRLISSPFAHGLHLALYFAAAVTLLAAVASVMRGRRYVHVRESLSEEVAEGFAGVGELAAATVQAEGVDSAMLEGMRD